MFAPLTLLVVAMQGAAPVSATPAPAPVLAAAVTAVAGPAANSSEVDARIARADSLAFAGRMDRAVRLYEAVIDGQDAAGRYAKDALWHLAMAYYVDGDPVNTVRTLDQLANAAGRFGDPRTELEASYQSARFHAALHDTRSAEDRLARVRCLMQSPVIPDAVKADYETRLAERDVK